MLTAFDIAAPSFAVDQLPATPVAVSPPRLPYSPDGKPKRPSRSAPDLRAMLDDLPNMHRTELLAEWSRIYHSDPPEKVGRDVLELGIAFKWQERALGGLSSPYRRRVAELTAMLEETGDLARPRAVSLRSGARLIRDWHGETHEVLALDDGTFMWKGKVHRSLSLIAREITGTRWSGPRFFGLVQTECSGRACAVSSGTTKPSKRALGA